MARKVRVLTALDTSVELQMDQLVTGRTLTPMVVVVEQEGKMRALAAVALMEHLVQTVERLVVN